MIAALLLLVAAQTSAVDRPGYRPSVIVAVKPGWMGSAFGIHNDFGQSRLAFHPWLGAGIQLEAQVRLPVGFAAGAAGLLLTDTRTRYGVAGGVLRYGVCWSSGSVSDSCAARPFAALLLGHRQTWYPVDPPGVDSDVSYGSPSGFAWGPSIGVDFHLQKGFGARFELLALPWLYSDTLDGASLGSDMGFVVSQFGLTYEFPSSR